MADEGTMALKDLDWQRGRDIRMILSSNDPRLAPLIRAEDDASREEAMEEIVRMAEPVVDGILGRSGAGLQPENIADIRSTIMFRLAQRLAAVPLSDAAAIASLGDFVATSAYNGLHDFFRVRFPARARLKNRTRYVLTHDERLTMWNNPRGVACGLRRWHGSDEVAQPPAIAKENASLPMLARHDLGETVLAILGRSGKPLLVDDVVALVAQLWDVVEVETVPTTEALLSPDAAIERIEQRQTLAVVWEEICRLRAPQRAALLLNLRYADSASAIEWLVLTGIASFDAIAAALEMAPEGLAELWNELPLDDLRIAAMLGVSRQQVINLRSAARKRLSRRMGTGDDRR